MDRHCGGLFGQSWSAITCITSIILYHQHVRHNKYTVEAITQALNYSLTYSL